jgi:hypothetical protein
MDADFIKRSELQRIINERSDACISIYLPMVRVGPDVQGNNTRLKNALAAVEDTLLAREWRQKDIDELLETPRQLLTEAPFWQHQLDGLAVFVSPDVFETYRLPLGFEPLTIVSDRFHVKPILPLFSDDGRFHILALSQGKVRLFQGTRHVVDEIELKDTPRSIDDALWYDDPEAQLQHHTSTSGPGGEPAAEPGVVHHGQGVTDDEHLQRLRRYFDDVSDAVHEQLGDEDTPLVLAAVDYLHPIYKEVDHSPHLLDEGIEGNPDEMSAEELHEQAWSIVEPLFTEAKEEVRERYKQMAHTEQASDDLGTIVPAAVQGRVDALFVAVGTQKWGVYDMDSHSIQVHDESQNGDEDLLDFAAVQTMAYGGTVYAVDPAQVPGDTPIAAVFRF